ncbi:MAG: nicotinate (nicotinamide) nucleotide adenylyltransferase [Phycisphaerae bacterium]
MTRLCYGGSFNPIHHGHLLVARAIAEAGNFDRVVLIPSAQPPHKPAAADLALPHERLALCQAVSDADPLFEASDIELRRSGPSYTIDTAREFRQSGWPDVHWLIGADMLQILPKWHRYEQLLKEVTFWIARRPGYEIDWQTLPPAVQALRERVVTAPLIEMSATQVRERVRRGQSIKYLVPEVVERRILDRRLYIP